ncbi:MAG: hypothetical protein ACSHX8_07515 [Opitutaceae bacterium]
MRRKPYFTLFLGLHVLLVSVLHADLLPGDFAVTRIQTDEVVLLALKNIPAGETIEITDNFWIGGAFDNSGTTGTITMPPGGLSAGSQHIVNLTPFGMTLDFGETLHFYQNITPPFTTIPRIRHLFLIEFNKDGLRWWRNIPGGLLDDVTHIVIPEHAPGQLVDHIMKQDLLAKDLTPYEWMSALGSYRAWTDTQSYSPSELITFLINSRTVLPDAGIVSFPFERLNVDEQDGMTYVPIRRSFGSDGAAPVTVKATNIVEPLHRWNNLSPDDFAVDMTDIAWGAGTGMVAVSPKSGKLLINDGTGWTQTDTNGSSTVNLQLSGIMYDGTKFWACSLIGKIFSSSDGENWIEEHDTLDSNQEIYGIFHLPNATNKYVAVGDNGLFLYSVDGDNWSSSSTSYSGKLYAASYHGGKYVVVGEGGTVRYTTTLPSAAWLPAINPSTKDLYAICKANFGSGLALYAVGKHGTLITSYNLMDGFTAVESGTKRSLYDIKSFQLSSNGTQYLMAIGANGVTTLSENGEEFIRTRLLDRAPALYALTSIGGAASANGVHAVGEYGSVVSFKVNSQNLSGELAGVDLDNTMSTVSSGISWDDGISGEKYIAFSNANALALFRARIDLKLEHPSMPPSPLNYQIGQNRTSISLWRQELSGANDITRLVQNNGAQVRLKDVSLTVVNNDEWTLNFKVRNNSNSTSNPLFIRFEGTNLPDLDLPNVTDITNQSISPLTESGTISVTLRQPIEYISLYEEFRTGEVVKKFSIAINSLVADTNWVPNGIFPRSLGAYLNDNGNLTPIEIPYTQELLKL